MSQEYQGSQVLRDISFLLGLFQEVTSSLQEIDAQRRPSQKVSHISDCDWKEIQKEKSSKRDL